jgi:hypothetical protein
MVPAVVYTLTPERAAQLEGQKQGITRFAFTGVQDILERHPINSKNWCRLRMSMWYWLCAIGSAYKTRHDAAPNKAGGKIKERRRSGKVNTVAHEMYGPGNQLNAGADGGVAGGLGAASNGNRRTALQALAFQLGLDIVVGHLVPGYMQNKAIVLTAGFCTNPLIFVYSFDNKYFMQPGGQVHLWGPPESAIKKEAIWNPANAGFATLFARMTIIWENHEQAKRDVLNDDDWKFTVFEQFQHLRNIIKIAGQQCARMVFHQQPATS